jgi:tetratricopeptide (TPR) repeat protein
MAAGRKPRTPNGVLRGVRERERRQTRAEFAEAMARVARELGEHVYPDAKYVERLESGAIPWPGPTYRNILAKLCDRPIGELGFTQPLLSVPAFGDGRDATPARVNLPLRDAVLASGLEVSQLARKVGVNPKSAERWITQGRIPHPRHRWKACQILDRDESDLWPDAVPDESRNSGRPADYVAGPSFHGILGMHSKLNHSDILPVLNNISRVSAASVIAALREVQQGYLKADRLMGGLSVSSAVRTQIPLIEKACEVTRGADRADALSFAGRFMEFCGWVHQDAGDLSCAMFWTDRALDYAMELDDLRAIAYTLMRKAAIATEAGNPAQGLGIANFALSQADVLTPRLRAVILRQRAHAHAALRETTNVAHDADNALAEAIAGVTQGEEDRAPYCSPMYVAMETGQSMVAAGQPADALMVLARSRAEWSDRSQVRDYTLCVSRLATAYAAAGEAEEACKTAEEAISLAQGIGSRRVIGQLNTLSGVLGRWRSDPAITVIQGKLGALIGSFRPE